MFFDILMCTLALTLLPLFVVFIGVYGYNLFQLLFVTKAERFPPTSKAYENAGNVALPVWLLGLFLVPHLNILRAEHRWWWYVGCLLMSAAVFVSVGTVCSRSFRQHMMRTRDAFYGLLAAVVIGGILTII